VQGRSQEKFQKGPNKKNFRRGWKKNHLPPCWLLRCCLVAATHEIVWPPDAMMLGTRGSPSSFAPPLPTACAVWASRRPAPAPSRVGTLLGTELRLGDRREEELARTGRPERRSREDGRSPGALEKGLELGWRETSWGREEVATGKRLLGGTRKIRNTTLTRVTVFDKFSNTVRAQRDCNSPCK
jgi:hypothetical protein